MKLGKARGILLTYKEYTNYLNSEKWKQKKSERLAIDKYRCQGCGSTGNRANVLTVHHMNYKHLGNEDVYTELCTLCTSCHRIVTNMMNRKRTVEEPRGNWYYLQWHNDEEFTEDMFYTSYSIITDD